MNPMIPYKECPVNGLPPIFSNAIYETANQTKAPLDMVANLAIGVVSLVCQNKVNVCRMEGLISPCSVFVMSVGDSGERKTGTENKLMEPIQEMENMLLDAYKKELAIFDAKKFAWEQKKKIIASKIKKAINSNEKHDHLTKELEELFIEKPVIPKRKKMKFNDATPAAIKHYLGEHNKSIGIMSDEGGTILNAKIVDDLSFLNKLWDGSDYSTERKTIPSHHITGARLTMSILVQSSVLNAYLIRQGENARGSGFLARFLFCYPPSTQGTRYITNPVTSTEHLQVFHERMKSILHEDKDPITLNLDHEAKKCWIDYFNEIESQLLPDGYLYHFRDYASKVADNAARIAALIHYFIGNDGDISRQVMTSAIHLSRWYLNEYIRVFSVPNEEQSMQLESNELFLWINNFCMTNRITYFKKNHLLQYGPNRFREKRRLDFLLNILCQQNRIWLWNAHKTNYIGIGQNPNIPYIQSGFTITN
ncbi:CP4-57 prophage; hypothetical protein [Tolumonas auensis DSM 9187]|uniref:DUF3987 domain-containing protein n=1 Tax=Tolumonas auensis (strain DSM 9187 / NBRC 110442 / TA 4) TaxID=595494 RepID=C4LDJ5_TOLAT|nr:YfjI family protein [Tolumonas auensis]ACQ92791.1 CP4-57 prophage; hypothetical protein [Tolumonas auensis DSM 9187]